MVAKNRRDNAEAVANTAATRLAAHKELVTALTAVSDSGSQSLIGQFHRVELLRDADLALSTKIEYSGGEVETTNSMWSQGRVSYLGGVTVSYKIIDLSTRTIRKSGVMTEARAASYKGRDGSGALKSLNPEMKE